MYDGGNQTLIFSNLFTVTCVENYVRVISLHILSLITEINRFVLLIDMSCNNVIFRLIYDQIVKAIDAVSREQLVQILAFVGMRNVTPVFSLVPTLGPFRTAALLPTITEEDRVILNNVQKIVEFLAAGTVSSSNGVSLWLCISVFS